jgi:hypothetical protein
VIEYLKEAKKKSLINPRWFVENILRQTETDDWQFNALQAIADVHLKSHNLNPVLNLEGLNRISIRSCHGTGKTHVLGLILHWWNWCFTGLVVGTAPKQQQIITRFMPRYRKILRDAIPEYQRTIKVDSLRVKILGDPDWGFIGETASEPENMAGYHDTPQLILVDEGSARALDAMFPVIEGTLTTPGSVLIVIGNPTRLEGEFWASHNKKGTKELYYKIHVKPEDSRYVSSKWLTDMASKYGETSPIYKIRCLGEFASFDEAILIPLFYLEEAQDIEEVSDGSVPVLRVSIDVSDGGADSTQITACNHYESFTQLIKQKGFWFKTETATLDAAEAAINIFEACGGRKDKDEFVVDAIGVGAGTAAYLSKLGYKVIVHKGSETDGIDTKRWRNRRVMCAIKLYEMLRDGKLHISPDAIDDLDTFIQHMTSVKRASNERVDDIETKEKLKKDAGFSPDKFDSLAMQFSRSLPAGYTGAINIDTVEELNRRMPMMESANANW